MANEGYGNHETQAPGESADPKAAAQKPDSGATDRPGLDLGGASDTTAASGSLAGSHAVPDSSGVGPHGAKEGTGAVLTDSADDAQTPGTGALPGVAQGNEVDPGGG